MNSKAQIFSGEFLLAYFIFMAVVIMATLLWYNTTMDLSETESYKVIEEKSVDVAEQLIKNQGTPTNWNTTNVYSVGLVNESRVLSAEKILNFINIMDDTRFERLCSDPSLSNYMCNRHLLGLEGYDFHYALYYLNGSTVSINGKDAVTGKSPTNQTQLITVRRNALLDGEIVKTTLTVWYASKERTT
jgi:hypothetical protein